MRKSSGELLEMKINNNEYLFVSLDNFRSMNFSKKHRDSCSYVKLCAIRDMKAKFKIIGNNVFESSCYL